MLSLWDVLPNEIKSNIFKFCDPLTLHLHNLLPDCSHDYWLDYHQSEEIWHIAVALNWDGDLSSLPQKHIKLPSVLSGLNQVTSKSFYKQLLQLEYHRSRQVTELLDHLNFTSVWIHNSLPIWGHPSDYKQPMSDYGFEKIDKTICAFDYMLIHIPMRHCWIEMDEMQDLISTTDKFKLLVVVGFFGHLSLFQQLYHDLITTCPDIHTEKGIPTAFNFIFQIAASRGHVDVVQWLLQFKDVVDASHDNRNARLACQNGHFETVNVLSA
ncbi:hypothetical protein HDU76_005092, partial [Blyttiomyces sp. JEL0837]